MKQNLYSTIYILLLLLLLAGCNDLLQVTPENKKTGIEFWKTKVDVEQAVVGSYSRLQGAVRNFFVWSEVRGEMIEVLSRGGNDLINLNKQIIDEKNGYADWSQVYSTINSLNTVIALSPFAQKADPTFTRKELVNYLGECKVLRALCYYYLARTFYELPYITQPSENDQQNYYVSSISNAQVMDSIISELTVADTMVRENIDFTKWPFNTDDSQLQDCYSKGRITRPAVWALLTDVYLTKNNYEKSLSYANRIVYENYGSTTQFDFVPGSNWHEIFNPGNSKEGIFELQFTQQYNNPGEFTRWFSSLSDHWFQNKLNKNTNTYMYWEGDDYQKILENDHRGAGGTFLATDKSLIWKWAGGTDGSTSRNTNQLDANYIFYRYSDIFLMKAEALNRLGRSEEAAQMLVKIRQRAGFTEKSLSFSSVENLEEQILDERARELAFEGKRWFDLVRIAKRQNYMILAKRIADFNDFPADQNKWFQMLSDSLYWYMPVYYKELELNKNLRQNPFYIKTK